MNAVLSADTLPWRESAAFKPSLCLGDINPLDVYEFVSNATFDTDFRDSVLVDAHTALARFRLPAAGRLREPELVEPRLALDEEEHAALDELLTRMRGMDVDSLRAVETAALREGVGMPAVALLVVAVAVAVFVAVFLYRHPVP
jgi:hypothetical protein